MYITKIQYAKRTQRWLEQRHEFWPWRAVAHKQYDGTKHFKFVTNMFFIVYVYCMSKADVYTQAKVKML